MRVAVPLEVGPLLHDTLRLQYGDVIYFELRGQKGAMRVGDPGLDLYQAVFGHAEREQGITWPQGGHILEIGCAEADWMGLIHQTRPDLSLTGVDWCPCEPRPGTVIRGDVLEQEFDHLDGVVGISSIEHIGLGHYEQDPLDVDGDQRVMERIARWLRPGGLVYLDVPYQPEGFEVRGTACRIYDEAALQARIMVNGLVEVCRAYAAAGDPSTLLQARPTVRANPFYYVALILRKRGLGE